MLSVKDATREEQAMFLISSVRRGAALLPVEDIRSRGLTQPGGRFMA